VSQSRTGQKVSWGWNSTARLSKGAHWIFACSARINSIRVPLRYILFFPKKNKEICKKCNDFYTNHKMKTRFTHEYKQNYEEHQRWFLNQKAIRNETFIKKYESDKKDMNE
jgi:hypothetical protein